MVVVPLVLVICSDTGAADLWGLRSRAKFHKQYRRNGIPTARMKTSKYAVMVQFSLSLPHQSFAKGPKEVLEKA
jgi:hypothetical protein